MSAPKVAVLDDDENVVASITEALNEKGIDASPFVSAESLEAAALQVAFAAFVLDWLLDDTTAATLISKLRASPAHAQAPIFVLSGNLAVGGVPSDLELATAIREYRLEYRAKPFSTVRLAQDLITAIHRVPR
jgi:DNA-binding response OmpR family regulator